MSRRGAGRTSSGAWWCAVAICRRPIGSRWTACPRVISMHTHEVPRHACPTCGVGNDRATELPGVNDGGKPKVGDHLICFNCGQLCRLGVGFVLEPADIPADASKKERAQV